MVALKTIKVNQKVKDCLDKKKKYSRETYNDVLERLLFKRLKGGFKK